MSRDDGMDEHGNAWVCGCHLVGFWLGNGEIKSRRLMFSNPDHKSDPA
jgi:hypothetical protein